MKVRNCISCDSGLSNGLDYSDVDIFKLDNKSDCLSDGLDYSDVDIFKLDNKSDCSSNSLSGFLEDDYQDDSQDHDQDDYQQDDQEDDQEEYKFINIVEFRAECFSHDPLSVNIFVVDENNNETSYVISKTDPLIYSAINYFKRFNKISSIFYNIDFNNIVYFYVKPTIINNLSNILIIDKYGREFKCFISYNNFNNYANRIIAVSENLISHNVNNYMVDYIKDNYDVDAFKKLIKKILNMI